MRFFALEVVGKIVRAFEVLGFFFEFLRLGLREDLLILVFFLPLV